MFTCLTDEFVRCETQCETCAEIQTTPTRSRHLLPEHRDVTAFLQWAHDTFAGTDPDVQARKVLEEAKELVEDWDSAEEMADVVMTVLYCASLNGVDLRAAFRAKLNKNLGRSWRRGEDGTYNHIEDRDADEEGKEGAGGGDGTDGAGTRS